MRHFCSSLNSFTIHNDHCHNYPQSYFNTDLSVGLYSEETVVLVYDDVQRLLLIWPMYDPWYKISCSRNTKLVKNQKQNNLKINKTFLCYLVREYEIQMFVYSSHDSILNISDVMFLSKLLVDKSPPFLSKVSNVPSWQNCLPDITRPQEELLRGDISRFTLNEEDAA